MADHLYVCNWSNGHIKVGRSIDPEARIASHVERVACVGVELVDHIVVECAGSAMQAEATLIEACAKAAGARFKSEWFDGLDYEVVCGWARAAAAVVKTEQPLTPMRAIRDRLQMTQAAIGAVMGCTQGNVYFYEQGRTIHPASASRLIAFAATRGLHLTFAHIYEGAPLPQSIAGASLSACLPA